MKEARKVRQLMYRIEPYLEKQMGTTKVPPLAFELDPLKENLLEW